MKLKKKLCDMKIHTHWGIHASEGSATGSGGEAAHRSPARGGGGLGMKPGKKAELFFWRPTEEMVRDKASSKVRAPQRDPLDSQAWQRAGDWLPRLARGSAR